MPDQPPDLPPAVKALSAPKRAAWQALAEGRRFKDAAAAAGVTVHTVWRWCRDEPFATMHSHRLIPHLDAASDAIGDALDGQHDIATRLKAASVVAKGLGIGIANGSGRDAARGGTLTLQVNLVGVLPSAAQSTGPVVDVSTATAELSQPTVADSQPIRSRASSRKPTR